MIVLKAVNVFEIAFSGICQLGLDNGSEDWKNIQSIVSPLYFFDNVETAVDDELVHVSGLMAETGNAVSASLGSAEFMFEEGVVSCTDDCEVV